ncbi:hypothetical protein FRC03_011475 [Tulasnella sp. 419]|nr:hypothetical protein FRC02_007841 [Tulasnella sp. 418]KAG8954511.1 hypothetical protein FRC03_011475 [Tulasnella sp. 419]
MAYRIIALSNVRHRAFTSHSFQRPAIQRIGPSACQLRSKSSLSPMDWIASKLRRQAMYRQQDSVAEVQAAKEEAIQRGEASVFDVVEQSLEKSEEGTVTKLPGGKKHTEHKYSTAMFKMSPRKLNMLGRQISGKPIDHAILQMQFSDKRAAKRIKSTLCLARDHAIDKGISRPTMVVAEAWVNKGTSSPRIDIKGRGRHGIKHLRYSRLVVKLKEGQTREDVVQRKREKAIKRAISAGVVREDVPIRNPAPYWTW